MTAPGQDSHGLGARAISHELDIKDPPADEINRLAPCGAKRSPSMSERFTEADACLARLYREMSRA